MAYLGYCLLFRTVARASNLPSVSFTHASPVRAGNDLTITRTFLGNVGEEGVGDMTLAQAHDLGFA